jgi:NADH-quinone oxidoreductase subunit E
MTLTTTCNKPAQSQPPVVEAPIHLPDCLIAEIDRWAAQYPPIHRQSALLPALLAAQRQHNGWLPRPVIDAVADYLQVTRITAYEVVTFYSLFELKPVGKNKISVCTNISCLLKGCDRIVKQLKTQLKINFGETTPDGLFTLKAVECLGACIHAPVACINEQYYENLTPEKIDQLLETLCRQTAKIACLKAP